MQGTCDEEGRESLSHLLQGSKVRDENHNEEETKKAEQWNLEPGTQSIFNKKRKGPREKFSQQKLPLALSNQDKCYSAIAHFFACDS